MKQRWRSFEISAHVKVLNLKIVVIVVLLVHPLALDIRNIKCGFRFLVCFRVSLGTNQLWDFSTAGIVYS